MSRRPRLAYLVSRFPKITETFILYEILELERQGFEVRVFSLVRELGGVAHPEAERLALGGTYGNAPVAILAAQLYWVVRRPIAYLGAWWGALVGNLRSPKFLQRAFVTVPVAAHFAREMRRSGTEHLHAHWATHPALAAWVAARLLHLPYSFTAHAHDIYVERPMLREKIHDARFVVTISEYNRRFLARLYPDLADNVTVIHCGVDLSAFEPQPREERPAGPWTVVSVASLQPQKGHAYLVRACAILRARGIDVRCLFIGEGPEEASLRRQISDAGLDEVVHLLGALPRPRVIAALAGADAMALASVRLPKGKMEGIPVSLMEAMAMALPVVATDLSGVPELVRDGETGLLAPERDAEALASALASLHDDPDRAQRLAEAGRRHVAEAFDLRINTARLAALFEANLVAEGASSGRR